MICLTDLIIRPILSKRLTQRLGAWVLVWESTIVVRGCDRSGFPLGMWLSGVRASHAEVPFWGFRLSVSNGCFFLSKIYDKAVALSLIMHAFPFWMVTFPVVPLCGMYISQLVKKVSRITA